MGESGKDSELVDKKYPDITNNLKHLVIRIIYLIGCFIALVLGIRLLYKEGCNSKENDKTLQYGMCTINYNVLDFCIFNIMENTR